MKSLSINGETLQLAAKNLAELIDLLKIQGSFAIALNNQVVPKSELAMQNLNDGDHVEIIRPTVGG